MKEKEFKVYSSSRVYLDNLNSLNDGDELIGIDICFSNNKQNPYYLLFYRAIYRSDKNTDDNVRTTKVSMNKSSYFNIDGKDQQFTKKELNRFIELTNKNIYTIRYHLLSEYRYGDIFKPQQFYNYFLPDYRNLETID